MLLDKPVRKYLFFYYFGEFILKLSRLVFLVSSLTFVVYFWLENLKVGLISNYFDLNILILIAVLSLVVLLFGTGKDTLAWLRFRNLGFSLILATVIALVVTILVKFSLVGSGSTGLALIIGAVVCLIIYQLKKD